MNNSKQHWKESNFDGKKDQIRYVETPDVSKKVFRFDNCNGYCLKHFEIRLNTYICESKNSKHVPLNGDNSHNFDETPKYTRKAVIVSRIFSGSRNFALIRI